MPFITQYLSKDHLTTADILISLIVAGLGIFSAIQQGGVFGYVAMFPPQLMGVCMFG